MRIFNNVLQIYSFLNNNAAILSIGSQTDEFPLNACGLPMAVLCFVAQLTGSIEQVVDLPRHLLALVRIRYRLQLLLQRLSFPASLARLLPHLF